MRKNMLLLCGIALSTAFASVPAHAQALIFDLSGSRTATFTLDDSIPDSFTTNAISGDQIFFNNVAGTFSGSAGTGNISFGTNVLADLSLQSANLDFTQFTTSASLFTGSASNPMFTIGTFSLSGGFTAGPATLTISRAVAAVPEPGTWAMMLLGFGAIGVAARRRRAALTLRRI